MIRPDLLRYFEDQERLQHAADQATTILENLRDQLDPQMKGWSRIGGAAEFPADVSLDPARLREQSKRAYYQEPFGRVIIRNLVKFIIGTGTIIDWEEKNESKLEALQEWWKKATKSIKWFGFQREYVTRFFRDGEVFVRRFILEDDKPLRLRFIDPDRIDDDGIITDPDDVETVIAYRIGGPNGEIVPAEEIHHLKNADANMKRGRPILEVNLPYITKHKKWLEARMVLNIVRSSVAVVQEVQGTTTDLFRLRSQQKANARGSNTDRAKMLQPGTIIRGTPGTKYSMLSPNLDAKDASEDGRTIQLAMAAGSGFPDALVTADWSKNNFASSAIAQNPAIREFEDWGGLIVESMQEIVDWILKDGLEKRLISVGTKFGYEMGFPPLLKRDLQQETAAYHTMWEDGVMSIPTWRLKAGLDNDKEQKQVDASGGPPILKKTPAEAPPKRADDKNPRQATVAGSGESTLIIPEKKRKISVKVKPKKEIKDESARNYEVECEVVQSEGDIDMGTAQAA